MPAHFINQGYDSGRLYGAEAWVLFDIPLGVLQAGEPQPTPAVIKVWSLDVVLEEDDGASSDADWSGLEQRGSLRAGDYYAHCASVRNRAGFCHPHCQPSNVEIAQNSRSNFLRQCFN